MFQEDLVVSLREKGEKGSIQGKEESRYKEGSREKLPIAGSARSTGSRGNREDAGEMDEGKLLTRHECQTKGTGLAL